jgi:serine/threonine-protein kinase
MTEAEPAEHDSLLGARIDGRYTVHREIGRGGMGVVYEGVHDDLGRQVAIKVLNLAWASDPTAVARFLREARTASSFSHGNIVDVTDLGRLADGRPYLIMPKIVGTDLAALLSENGPQPAKRVADLLAGVAAALDLIHAKGFVHRDIKPENLMFVVREDGSETVMLLDFGIAAAVMSNEPRLTGQGAIFGTPQFMPPEVCNGGMPDARGDVYALATVAFELITGVLPFGDDNMMRVLTAKLTSDPPSLAESSGVPFPAELEVVIAHGLARDPRERFAHASEFIAALKAATEHAPVSWRSGVLRPSFRSSAVPVGTHTPPPSPVPSRPLQSSQPSRPPYSSQPARPQHTSQPARPQHTSQPARPQHTSQPARPQTPQPSYRQISPPLDPNSVTQRTPSQPRRQHVAPQFRAQYTQQPQNDYTGRQSALGAGLRASERLRNPDDAHDRPSGGGRIAILLGLAALLMGFLWYRHNQGSVLETFNARGLPPLAAEPSRQPAAPSAAPPGARPNAAPSNAAPSNPAPSNAAPSEPQADTLGTPTAPPSAAVAPGVATANAQDSANDPSVGAAHGTLSGVTANPTAEPMPSGQAPSPPSAAVAAAAARNPTAGPSVSPHVAAPLPAVKPGHPGAARGTAPAKPSTVTAEPPAPREEVGEPEAFSAKPPAGSTTPPAGSTTPPAGSTTPPPGSTPPAGSTTPPPGSTPPGDSPVLVVQEEEPPPAEEAPDLPVRSPESQAAQLARDASTALLAGEVGHAIELLREATRLDPNQALAWRTMGLAFERSGDTQAALGAYRQYIRLAPHGPQADMVRERMNALNQ